MAKEQCICELFTLDNYNKLLYIKRHKKDTYID